MWTCIKLNCPPLLVTFYAKGSLSWIVALTIYERPCENKNSKFNCTPSTKEMIFCTGLFFLLWACRILIICKIWNTILSTLQLACAAKCLNIWRRKKLSYLTILFANGILIILTILIILCLTGWFGSFGYYMILYHNCYAGLFQRIAHPDYPDDLQNIVQPTQPFLLQKPDCLS